MLDHMYFTVGRMRRRQFSQCAEDLRTEGRAKEADLFSLSTPEVQLHDLGDYRCAALLVPCADCCMPSSKRACALASAHVLC